MSTAVCYFSGTGNSLSVAKDIAQSLHGTLVPMASAINKKSAATNSDKIGLVFPAYMAHLYGIPLIGERFIRGLENLDSKYIFADGLPTLRNLARLVRSLGGRISAENINIVKRCSGTVVRRYRKSARLRAVVLNAGIEQPRCF